MEEHQRIDGMRQRAVVDVLGTGGIAGVLALARVVSLPEELGLALGKAIDESVDNAIVPALFDTGDEVDRRVAAGFIWARNRKLGWNWVDRTILESWSPSQKAAFLRALPFEAATWQRVAAHLGYTEETEGEYWKSVVVNPYGPDRDLTTAIKMLTKYGRADAAVLCSATTIRGASFDADLAVAALLAVLESGETAQRLDTSRAVEVINQLQSTNGVDQNRLFEIEWNFLPLLGRFSQGSPRTLEYRLASSPTFFGEVIGLVFRPRDTHAETQAAPTEKERALARNAYSLLNDWRIVPGSQSGAFDPAAFSSWVAEATKMTRDSGHLDAALDQIGNVLTHAPADPNGLWIHEVVASVLNKRENETMRRAFTRALFNARGMYPYTAGEEERELALRNRAKADALEGSGHSRFATAMRELARGYERLAEREVGDGLRD